MATKIIQIFVMHIILLQVGTAFIILMQFIYEIQNNN